MSPLPTDLREDLERQRRATLHRQIGALENRLTELARGHRPGGYLEAIRLRSKIARLHQKLNQPMLLPT